MITVLNKKELILLKHLRNNSRAKLTELSKLTAMPVSSIYDKIIQYKKAELIKKHTVILDFDKIGFSGKAILIIKINKNQKDDFKEFVLKHHSVNSLYRINHGYDYILEVIFPNMKCIDDFLDRLEKTFDVLELETHYILDELKKEAFTELEIFK